MSRGSLLSNLSPSTGGTVNNAVTGLGQPLLQAGQAAGINLNTLFPGGVPLINPAAIGQTQAAAPAPGAGPAPDPGRG